MWISVGARRLVFNLPFEAPRTCFGNFSSSPFFSLSLDPDCILQVFVYAFACSNTCSFHAVEHGWRSRGREAVPCCSSRRNVYKTIRSLGEILVRVMRRKPRVRYGEEGGGGGGIRSIKNRFAGISLYVAMWIVHVANAIFFTQYDGILL